MRISSALRVDGYGRVGDLGQVPLFRPANSSRKRSGLALGLFIALATLPALGEAAEVFRFRGEFATAFFETTSGCTDTSVFVSAFDDHFEKSSVAFISIIEFDICTSEVTLSASGSTSLEQADFTVEKRLEAASLDVAIEMVDFITDTSFAVDVQVDWVATAPVEQTRFHESIRSPGFFFQSQSRGRFRDAEASGTVSDGSTEYAPEPAQFADIRLQASGAVTVSH